MAKFDIYTVSNNGREFKVTQDYYYWYKGEWLIVPKGFITDFASIPRVFWNIYPPTGIYMPAALLHDFYYACELKSPLPYAKDMDPRYWCDCLFYDVMKDCGCNWFTRYTMYRAVRDWGWITWNSKGHSEKAEITRQLLTNIKWNPPHAINPD